MDSFERITPGAVEEMTRERAEELYHELELLRDDITAQMELLKAKAWPPAKPGKCERCGSTELTRMKNGGYLCRCGLRVGARA